LRVPLPSLPSPAKFSNTKIESIKYSFDTRELWPSIADTVSWLKSIDGLPMGSLEQDTVLHHRLSGDYNCFSESEIFHERSIQEIRTLQRVKISGKFGGKNCNWRDLILFISNNLNDGHNHFRSCAVFTEPDKNGNYAVYPSHALIEKSIYYLGMYIARYVEKFPIETAIVSLVFLGAIHPFEDGNGRTSRVLFNKLAGFDGFSGYFPINEIAAHSRGGYILSLREAQYNDNWYPIVEFLDYSIRFFRRRFT
jgi:hypothetical protein